MGTAAGGRNLTPRAEGRSRRGGPRPLRAGADGRGRAGDVLLPARGEKQQPDLTAKVDGKEVRAVGADLKPLDVAELGKRLPGYRSVVVIQAEFELPDAFFLKVLHQRSVIFVLPKKMFAPMAKASEARLAPGQQLP
jgi:hypothetical protein